MGDISPIELHILERMLEDRARTGSLSPLSLYLEIFADYEDVVRSCYRLAGGELIGEEPAPDADSRKPHSG